MNLNKVTSTLFSLLLLLAVSCSKDSSQDLNLPSDDVSFSVAPTGLLKFASLDDLYRASQLYNKDQNFKNKINKSLPNSLEASIASVLKTNSNQVKETTHARFFSHFIELNTSQGKPYYKVKFPFLHYAPFLSEDGIVIVDEVYVKFSKTYVASSKILSELTKINETGALDLVSKDKEFQLQGKVLVSNISTTSISRDISNLRDESSSHGKYCANNGYDRLECWVYVFKTVIMNSSSDYDVSIDIVTESRKDETPDCSDCCNPWTGSWYGSTSVSGSVSIRLLPSNLLYTGGPISTVNGSNTGYLGLAWIPCYHHSNNWSIEPEFRILFSFNVSGDMAIGSNISFNAWGEPIL